MIRANLNDKHIQYSDPTQVTLSNAEMQAIDTATSWALYPYAHTATVEDSHQECTIYIADDIPASNKFGIGVFLSTDKALGNLLFNVNGALQGYQGSNSLHIFPFFGRTDATSVTSTKVATANLLDNYIILPQKKMIYSDQYATSFNESILGYEHASDEIWCCGWVFQNLSGGDITFRAEGNININKFSEVVACYKPDRI